jgi:nicotinamide phosphoribosyltransferase
VYARPDSGDVIPVLQKTTKILEEKYGFCINSKGYKVLNNIKVIQGDGIKKSTIGDICHAITKIGYSIDNFKFGMGGAMVHSDINRDTYGFAQKTSWVEIDGIGYNVRKNPITDPGKESISGRFDDLNLPIVFLNGELVKKYNFSTINRR